MGGALGYVICTQLSRNPKVQLAANLINNAEALRLISNFQQNASTGDAVSGHLDLGVLLAYIDEMKVICSAAGKDLSGLEYYFAKYGPADNAPSQNQNTILLYPTFENAGAHIPFDPEINLNVVTMYAQYQADLQSNVVLSGTTYNSANVLNRTHMSPPRQPSTL